MTKIEEEYEEFMDLLQEVGISEIMELYNQSKELLNICTQYLKELDPKFTFLTTNKTY